VSIPWSPCRRRGTPWSPQGVLKGDDQWRLETLLDPPGNPPSPFSTLIPNRFRNVQQFPRGFDCVARCWDLWS